MLIFDNVKLLSSPKNANIIHSTKGQFLFYWPFFGSSLRLKVTCLTVDSRTTYTRAIREVQIIDILASEVEHLRPLQTPDPARENPRYSGRVL